MKIEEFIIATVAIQISRRLDMALTVDISFLNPLLLLHHILLLVILVDGSLPAVVRLDGGRHGGAKEENGGQAAVGDPVVRHPVQPLPEHRAEDPEDLSEEEFHKMLKF